MAKLFHLPQKSWRTYQDENERWINLSAISYLRKCDGKFFIEMIGQKGSIRISEEEFEKIKVQMLLA